LSRFGTGQERQEKFGNRPFSDNRKGRLRARNLDARVQRGLRDFGKVAEPAHKENSMLVLALAAIGSATGCTTQSVRAAADAVLSGIRDRNYGCIQSIIKNPELKFPNGKIALGAFQSLSMHTDQRKSYEDIAKSGPIFIDIAPMKGRTMVFFIERRYKREYEENEQRFRDKYFLKRYFSCNFVEENGRWKLTEDFCFTEMG
jgi:hypothetical protein